MIGASAVFLIDRAILSACPKLIWSTAAAVTSMESKGSDADWAAAGHGTACTAITGNNSANIKLIYCHCFFMLFTHSPATCRFLLSAISAIIFELPPFTMAIQSRTRVVLKSLPDGCHIYLTRQSHGTPYFGHTPENLYLTCYHSTTGHNT